MEAGRGPKTNQAGADDKVMSAWSVLALLQVQMLESAQMVATKAVVAGRRTVVTSTGVCFEC
jgi:hypothetical protein